MSNLYGHILYFFIGDPKDQIYFGFYITTKYPISNENPLRYNDLVYAISSFFTQGNVDNCHRYAFDSLNFNNFSNWIRVSKNFITYQHNCYRWKNKVRVIRNFSQNFCLEDSNAVFPQAMQYIFEVIYDFGVNFSETLFKKYMMYDDIDAKDYDINGDSHPPSQFKWVIDCDPWLYKFVPEELKQYKFPFQKTIKYKALNMTYVSHELYRLRLNMAYNLNLWVYFDQTDLLKFQAYKYTTREEYNDNLQYAKLFRQAFQNVQQAKLRERIPYGYFYYDPAIVNSLYQAHEQIPLYGQGFFAMNPIIQGQLNEREIYPNPSYIGWKLVHKPHPNNSFRLVYKRECQYPGYLGNGELNKCDGDDLVAIVFKPKETPEPYFDLKMDDYIGSDAFFEMNKHLPVDEQTRMHLELAKKQDEWHRRLDYKLEMRLEESQLAKDINSVIRDFVLEDVEEEEDIESREEAIKYLTKDRGRELYPFDDILSPTELLKYYKSYGGKYEWGYYDLKFSIDHINLYISQFGLKDIPYIANKIQNALRNELFYILLFSGVNFSACPIITQNIISDLKYSLYDTRLFREGLRDFFSPKVRMALCQIMNDMMERIKSILKGSQFDDNLSHLIKKI